MLVRLLTFRYDRIGPKEWDSLHEFIYQYKYHWAYDYDENCIHLILTFVDNEEFLFFIMKYGANLKYKVMS